MATGIETNRTSITLPKEVSTEILQKTQEESADNDMLVCVVLVFGLQFDQFGR